MQRNWELIKTYIAFAVSLIVNLLGGYDDMLYTLLLFMALDIATGLLLAIKEKSLSSSVMTGGLIIKTGIIFAVILAHAADVFLSTTFLRTFFIALFILNEGISIVENLANIGVPIPTAVREVLVQVKENMNKSTMGILKSLFKDRFNSTAPVEESQDNKVDAEENKDE